MKRREFIGGAAAATLAACARPPKAPKAKSPRFEHGVASGDPLADRVILWTRVSGAAHGTRIECVVARDPDLEDIVVTETTTADEQRDFTVKIDAVLPKPGTIYYYQFRCDGAASPIGRTRTLPVGEIEHLRLAFCSCSNLPWGFFHAYRHMAERDDISAVLHLGDYIYEHANGVYGDGAEIGRIPRPDRETVTLADYRERYAQYRLDADAQAMHSRHPVIAVWDDHELTNDAWRDGAENHQAGEGPWPQRRLAAVRAYYEYMPIRETSSAQAAAIYRGFRFGNLAQLSMLDTRLIGRDEQVAADDPRLHSTERSLLGTDQEAWLGRELEAAARDGVAWSVIGQQVLFSPATMADGSAADLDKWDGYPAARRRVLELAERHHRHPVVLTGDFHSSWAIEVPGQSGSPVAVEFLTPGVSAPIFESAPQKRTETSRELAAHNPHIRWTDFESQGYAVLDLSSSQARCEWYFVSDVRKRERGPVRLARAFATDAGELRLRDVTSG